MFVRIYGYFTSCELIHVNVLRNCHRMKATLHSDSDEGLVTGNIILIKGTMFMKQAIYIYTC
jgi:hypothetical protein